MSREAFSEFVDRISYVMLKAPDRFPADTSVDLEKAFADLFRGLNDSKEEVGPESGKVAELLEQSLAAYRIKDIRSGIRNLQEIGNILRTIGQS